MEEPAATLLSLPPDILARLAGLVLGCSGLAFGASCTAAQEALGEALCMGVPALAGAESVSRVGWSLALRRIRCGARGQWHRVQPLRAVRPELWASVPLQEPPRLSGASMCAMGESRLAVYGGRATATGETFGQLYMATIRRDEQQRAAVAQWDAIEPIGKEAPPARCYHTATRLGDAMVVFGGAGAEGDDADALRGDTWLLRPCSRHASGGGSGGAPPALRWEQLAGSSADGGAAQLQPQSQPLSHPEQPAPRSSHVAAAWTSPEGVETIVLHGGLANHGTRDDTWLLRAGPPVASSSPGGAAAAAAGVVAGAVGAAGSVSDRAARGVAGGTGAVDALAWARLQTSGERVARAHHCGGVVGGKLLVHSGQDARLLSVAGVACLDLRLARWDALLAAGALPSWCAPRIASTLKRALWVRIPLLPGRSPPSPPASAGARLASTRRRRRSRASASSSSAASAPPSTSRSRHHGCSRRRQPRPRPRCQHRRQSAAAAPPAAAAAAATVATLLRARPPSALMPAPLPAAATAARARARARRRAPTARGCSSSAASTATPT